MFNLSLDTPIPSIEKAMEILSDSISEFGIPVDYDRMLEYQAYYTITSTDLLKRLLKYINANVHWKDYKDDDFLRFLLKNGVSAGLETTATGEYSLSSDSLEAAIATGLYSEELCKIMQTYSKIKSYKTIIAPFKKIFATTPVCPVETWDNHRMMLLNPVCAPQNTGRVGYQHPGVTNFSREINDIFTVPKGWIKTEADSGQIEPRVIQSYVLKDPQLKKCTMLYNDAYFGYVHYCNYLTDEQRRSGTLDLKPIEITEEMKEKRKKFKTFGNAVMYGSTENKLNDADKANFIKYIGGHPQRVTLQRQIEDMIDRGQKVFYTAFGTPIDIMSGNSAVEDLKYPAATQFKRKVKRAINNPIQGTAADLMRYSVNKAYQMLLREAPNSRILMYVHDSGKFMIHEDEYDQIADRLKEITSYQVEDWIPIYSDYHEGISESKLPRFIA